MQNRLSVGLVGYGMAGRVFHAPLITACPDLQLTHVVERKRNEAAAVYPTITTVRSLDALLATDVDLVVIATPNTAHAPLAAAALQAGKHVVVDKPFTVTVAEAQRLTELARRHGRVLSVFHNRRWDSDFLTVRQLVATGRLGRIVDYNANYDRFRDYLKPNSWREADLPGSGLLYDLGSHLIDQTVVLFGRPDAVGAELYRQRDAAVVDDAFTLRLYYPTLTATLRTSMLMRQPRPRFRVVGTAGNFVKYGLDTQEDALKAGALPGATDWGAEPQTQWGTLFDAEAEVGALVGPETGRYEAFYANVAGAIRTTEPLAVTAEQATLVMTIIETAMEAARTQQRLPING